MNLHVIVSGAIGAVNPLVPVVIQFSSGSNTTAQGKRTPIYSAPMTVMAQVQSLTFQDITLLDSLNIQGVRRAMYLSGDAEAIVRVKSKGGDIITTSDGSVFLVAQVLERWPDWVKVAVTLQDGS